jgi:ADYC domain
MRTRMFAILSMSLLVAGHAGCWVEPDPGMIEPDAGIDAPGPECQDSDLPFVIQHDQVCPPETCGTNTPYVHGIAFDGLYVDGNRSDQGFRILGFKNENNDNASLSVEDGQFLAPYSVHQGTIELEWRDPSSGCTRHYDLKISDMHHWLLWTGHHEIPVYTIYAIDRKKPDNYEPICKKDDGGDTHAVLLVNERYDIDRARVLGTEPNWFTIACEGSALYKMRFAGYDPEVPTGKPYSSTPEERQATLKMITADYCGDDESSFTEVGTLVRWQNEYKWCSSDTNSGTKECPYFPVDTEIESHEAIWGPDGALCLDHPRLGKDVVCGPNKKIPPCDGATMARLGGHWETFNPIRVP